MTVDILKGMTALQTPQLTLENTFKVLLLFSYGVLLVNKTQSEFSSHEGDLVFKVKRLLSYERLCMFYARIFFNVASVYLHAHHKSS